jgi:type VI secretion system protein ImpG
MSQMKKLYGYYNRELGTLNQFNTEFAKVYPTHADAVGMVDGMCVDPHVVRLVQGCALLNARTQLRLDDSYPELTEALLSINYPHYLSAFPSVSIARVDVGGAQGAKLSSTMTIPRGAMLHSIEQDGVVCKFATAYPLIIAPVALSKVGFIPLFKGPTGTRLPPGVGSGYQLTIACTDATQRLASLGIKTLRVFIDGEAVLVAALRDALLLRSALAWAVGAADQPWRRLERIPIASVGFADEDALLPSAASAHPAYRLITEYFCCPDKFNFIDIDLEALTRGLPPDSRSVTLQVAIEGVAPNSEAARTLGALSERNLLLGCTPIVNLFKKAACPIEQDHTKTEYPLLADAKRAAAFDIYRVDSVRLVRDGAHGNSVVEFHPYYSMRHGLAGGRKGRYWIMRRDPIAAVTEPGYEVRMALVDIDLDPLTTETNTVSIELTCSNRDLPCRLKYGAPDGDLTAEQGSAGLPIRMLRKPSRPMRFSKDTHWRLISHLALNHQSLVQENLEAFTEMLALYNLAQSPVTERQIGGIVAIKHSQATAWLQGGRRGARVHGIEVRLTIDEDAFAGVSLHAFAEVLDHFLGLYVHLNSFVQLVILSASTGMELIRCAPRSGDLQLV